MYIYTYSIIFFASKYMWLMVFGEIQLTQKLVSIQFIPLRVTMAKIMPGILFKPEDAGLLPAGFWALLCQVNGSLHEAGGNVGLGQKELGQRPDTLSPLCPCLLEALCLWMRRYSSDPAEAGSSLRYGSSWSVWPDIADLDAGLLKKAPSWAKLYSHSHLSLLTKCPHSSGVDFPESGKKKPANTNIVNFSFLSYI